MRPTRSGDTAGVVIATRQLVGRIFVPRASRVAAKYASTCRFYDCHSARELVTFCVKAFRAETVLTGAVKQPHGDISAEITHHRKNLFRIRVQNGRVQFEITLKNKIKQKLKYLKLIKG